MYSAPIDVRSFPGGEMTVVPFAIIPDLMIQSGFFRSMDAVSCAVSWLLFTPLGDSALLIFATLIDRLGIRRTTVTASITPAVNH